MKRPLLVTAFNFLLLAVAAQPKTDTLLGQLVAANTNAIFQKIIQDPYTYRVQIIYTQINRDKHNNPSFKNYYFHYNPKLYFNPASMVKMPLAFLALEKLNALKRHRIDKNTTILFDSSEAWHRKLYSDTTARDKLPTIAHFIKRAFLVSENDPYNRLYQFMGQGELNRNLHKKGYTDVRITRQFMGLTLEQNRHTNPLRFVDKHGKTLYSQRGAINTDSFDFRDEIKLGKAYLDKNDSLVNEPFDFTKHNNLSLESLQQMLQSVLFPHSVPAAQRFNLSGEDYKFIYQYLSQYPSETPYPKYDTTKFYDSYVKFFFRDSTRRMPHYIRVFNKVGWSYGFLTDVSYVADFKNNIEFMLSATVYVNSDDILNDGKYEYSSLGHPFLFSLGQMVYNYEMQRNRKFRPDLSSLKIAYEKRDPNDTRQPLKEVDN